MPPADAVKPSSDSRHDDVKFLPDEQMTQEAIERLRASGYRELRRISCCFHEGILTLRGRVPSYYLKQVAQTVVLRLDRVEVINNRLEVIGNAVSRHDRDSRSFAAR